MTNIFMVRLYTSDGVGGIAIFSTLESAKQLVARLEEHNKFIDNHRHLLRPHEFEYIDRETGERFLFSYGVEERFLKKKSKVKVKK